MEWQTVLLLIVVGLVTVGYIVIGILYAQKKRLCQKLQISNHKRQMTIDKLEQHIEDYLKAIELKELDDAEAIGLLDDNLRFVDTDDITYD